MNSRALVFKLVVNSIISLAIMGGLLFLPAGTFDWWRAWTLLGIIAAGSIVSVVVLFPGHKDLLWERLRPPIQKKQPLTDKIILLSFLVSFYSMFAFIPLDVFRFHLMARPAAIVSSLGLALFILGWRIVYLALRENAFASLVVKLQEERRQTVIDSGVYGLVRHPMYAGGILFVLGIPLWLESYAATVLALFPVLLLMLRIPMEERYLRRELAGYEAYMRRVRYRIIPHVW
ncbi:MAG TPA: isoprenylcysteine carboxylmethyltransferase family protein [Thermodesulfovibrionales bacterium]|nr:isoprenylcysteine carboxylmethyltransferase family protein [Thermodesulfovibrionales bacterium]